MAPQLAWIGKLISHVLKASILKSTHYRFWQYGTSMELIQDLSVLVALTIATADAV